VSLPSGEERGLLSRTAAGDRAYPPRQVTAKVKSAYKPSGRRIYPVPSPPLFLGFVRLREEFLNMCPKCINLNRVKGSVTDIFSFLYLVHNLFVCFFLFSPG